MKFSFTITPCLLVAFLLVALAGSLCGYAPIYTLEQTIHQSDLDPAAGNTPMAITGLSNGGRLVGYYNTSTYHHGYPAATVQAFVWDQTSRTLSDIGHEDIPGDSSVATCVCEAGLVAGVYWGGGGGGVANQLGFVWQDGEVVSFASPEDGDIDAVTAVNAAGQAVGTYFRADSGYQRGFFWDGAQCVDLGDLGEGGRAFVWPASLNDAGQVAGTVFTYTPLGRLDTSVAFRWQAGTLTALDPDAGFEHSVTLAMNGAGEIVGSYRLPPAHPGTHPGEAQAVGGFDWLGEVPVDLGSLGGGGTTPFAVDELGRVTGTGYALDHTLHLFGWQAGEAGLTDQGAARLTASDQYFELAGVNRYGDAAGVVDGGVFVRGGRGGTLSALAAVAASPLDFQVNADGEPTPVRLNDAGLLACAGRDSTGAAVVVVLTADADGDGLPDGWEAPYRQGGAPFDPEGDPDGDGRSNREEYEAGTDPTDFYNGRTPHLVVVSGDQQTGPPNGFVPRPLVVAVTDDDGNPLGGAPVTFTVSQGGGQVQKSSMGAPGGSLTVRSDVDGQAQAFCKLPNVPNHPSQVTAAAGSGSRLVSVPFAESSDGGGGGSYRSPFDPSDVTALLSPDGSMDVTWTNHADPDDPDPINIQDFDEHGVYHTIATAPAGATSLHLPAR